MAVDKSKIAESLFPDLLEELKCGICYEWYSDDRLPKQLGACPHVYCVRCVHKWILASASPQQFSCPTCRALITIGPDGVNGMATSLALRTLALKFRQHKNNASLSDQQQFVTQMPSKLQQNCVIRKDMAQVSLSYEITAAKPVPRNFQAAASLDFAELVNQALKLFEGSSAVSTAVGASSSSSAAEAKQEEANFIDPIATARNRVGIQARLGSTGKYYCGKRLLNCPCCDGHCGPTNGCNCVDCMALDISSRRLPVGYLVNSDGFTARRGQTGKFYCGRRVLTGNWLTDGYCGPTNGTNCDNCRKLDTLSTTMYQPLMQK